jgi:hypothetical protein
MRPLRIVFVQFYNGNTSRCFTDVVKEVTMELLIGAGVLSICAVAGWMVLRRPLRQVFEDVHLDHARSLFHQRREWLEARFISALGLVDPEEGNRWESAQWHNEIVWARDRQTRRLLALVGVHFNLDGFDDPRETRQATAVFEFRKGQWFGEGKWLDEVRPDEAVGRNQRFEAVVFAPPHPRQVG